MRAYDTTLFCSDNQKCLCLVKLLTVAIPAVSYVDGWTSWQKPDWCRLRIYRVCSQLVASNYFLVIMFLPQELFLKNSMDNLLVVPLSRMYPRTSFVCQNMHRMFKLNHSMQLYCIFMLSKSPPDPFELGKWICSAAYLEAWQDGAELCWPQLERSLHVQKNCLAGQ